MSFQHFVASGFGLWEQNGDADTVSKAHSEATPKRRTRGTRREDAPERVPEDETRGEALDMSDRDRSNSVDLKQLALALVEERNTLLMRLKQSKEEINRLQEENEDLRNENSYRHLMMRKMKSNSKRQTRDFERQKAKIANALDDDIGLTGFITCLPKVDI